MICTCLSPIPSSLPRGLAIAGYILHGKDSALKMILSRAIKKYRRGGLSGLLVSGLRHSYAECNYRVNLAKATFGGNIPYKGERIYIDKESFAALDRVVQRAIIEGSMDNGTIELIEEHLPKSVPVIECGAGIGVVSCYIDSHTKRETIVLEPNKSIIEHLKKNRALNDADFKIVNKGYNSENNNLELYITDAFWGASTALDRDERTAESVEVEGINIDNLTNENEIDNFSLVTNMEGGEYDLVYNEMELLKERCDTMIIGFHTLEEYDIDGAIEYIEENGFDRIGTKGNMKICFKNINI